MSDSQQQFNIYDYVDALIIEMNMQNEEAEKLEKLKRSMQTALIQHLLQTTQDVIEPETIDESLEILKDEKDPYFVLYYFIQNSPAVQNALIDALNIFKKNTLEAFNRLKI